MKKIFAIAAIAMMALTANAQTWVGGELGFNSSKVKGADKAQTSFTIAPELGYNLSEDWAVAIKLGYAHDNNAFLMDEGGLTTNSFSINPYVRYNAVKMGNFTIFVDGGVSYSSVHANGFDENANVFGVAINPGVAYSINEKIGLVSHIGDLSYHTSKFGEYKVNTFNLGLTNYISFGMYVNL